MRASACIALLAATLLATAAGAAEIYKWVDVEGVTHLSQVPPDTVVPDVHTLEIPTTNPEDWDPADYDHSILNQARRTDERLAAEEEGKAEVASAPAPAPYTPPTHYYPSPDRYNYPGVRPRKRHTPYGHRYGSRSQHGHRTPWKAKRERSTHRPAHRYDYGDRFAHPARSHRRLGADKRFGYLGHRITHRRSRYSYYDR